MQTASKRHGYRNKRKRDAKTADRTIKRWKKKQPLSITINLISSSFVVLRSTTREQEQNFITPAVCSRVSCAIPSGPSLCCVVSTPDGSSQSFGQTLRGHCGRQLHHHRVDAAGQF